MLLIPPAHSCNFLPKFSLGHDSHHTCQWEFCRGALMQMGKKKSRSKMVGAVFTFSKLLHLHVLHLQAEGKLQCGF